MSAPANRHAVALVLGDRGVMILGPSRSGKTTLALSLIGQAWAAGIFARLVADDQVFLSQGGGRLIARVPETIAGLAETYGSGPTALPHQPRAVIDLAVELVEVAEAPRLGERTAEFVPGIVLPLLCLPRATAPGNVLSVMARLGLPPFRRGWLD